MNRVVLPVACGSLSLALLAGMSVLGDLPGTAFPSPGEPAWWVTVLGVGAQAAALWWVREHPRTVLVATAVPAPVVALAGAADATGVTTLAIIVAVYVAGSSRPPALLVPALSAVAVLMTAAGVVGAYDAGATPLVAWGGSLVQALGTVALVLLAATWVRALRESAEARRSQVQALASEQRALVQAAIARERTDMARELHDIAAHHLTGIAVMAAAVERQIDSDPSGAKEAVQHVRQQSTRVLRDLRSLVGLLREQDVSADARPETLAGIGDLVAEVAAGRDVSLTTLGDVEAPGLLVGPLAQLAAYRAVQEALANAGRHAPGAACAVTVDARADEAVVVTVRNAPPSGAPPVAPRSGGGFGLIGMRERAQLTGATLDVGPTDDGGWQVALRLPREKEAP